MTAYLLDVNVLVALLWPRHVGHTRAQNWFGHNSTVGWATCPFTQAGAIRILSNPAFSRDAVTIDEAMRALGGSANHPAHLFWPNDLSFADAVEPFEKRMVGYHQVTHAYLLGIAMHRQGKLVTMDRTVSSLLPGNEGSNFVVVI